MKPKNCLIFGGSGQIGRYLIRKLTKNNITNHLYIGLKLQLLTFDLSNQGRTNSIAMDPNIKTTPPNLSGIALNIA